MKGLAILLVVIGHVLKWNFDSAGPLQKAIYAFHMPLFMLLSGFVIKEIPSARKCVCKLCQFWMPFIIIGSIYSLIMGGVLLFFFDNMKMGFWYLISLGFMYMLLVPARYISNSKKKKGRSDFITLWCCDLCWIISNKKNYSN